MGKGKDRLVGYLRGLEIIGKERDQLIDPLLFEVKVTPRDSDVV